MKITVLGAGGAFSPLSRGNSSFLVQNEGRNILIDAGSSVQFILRDEMGIALQTIDDVIITHCHADHIGSLEAILYACKYGAGSHGKPNIWAPKRVLHEVIAALRPGMGWAENGEALCVYEEFFAQQILDSREVPQATVAGLPLTSWPVTHVGNMPCAAYLLGKLFISGDTLGPVFPAEVLNGGAELIFHEAEFGFKSGVHCPVAQLVPLPDEIRERTWLYHCAGDVDVPPGFAGILQKGQTFTLD